MEIPVSHAINAEDARKITAAYEAKCKRYTLDAIYTAIRKAAEEGKSEIVWEYSPPYNPHFPKTVFETMKTELIVQGFIIPISSYGDNKFSLTISWEKED